ncbi:MAG: BglG family transcription antiterminator [Erysipelotrichaceae bacterium]|nr:BglG family transcription antiterminator [Erysipelotrichaceae bacterium]
MDKRWLKIVDILNSSGPQSYGKLADKMDLTYKTIRKIIDEGKNDEADMGIHISSSLGKVSLTVTDDNLFNERHSSLNDITVPDDNESRIRYIITTLIKANDYVRIEDLADQMYVSRSTIDRLIPEIKESLKEYEITLISKAKKGICIEGSEASKRICVSHFFYDEDNIKNTESMNGKIQDILIRHMRQYQMNVGDINFYNLVQHCIITIRRIRKGNTLLSDENIGDFEEYPNELNCAKDIVKEFEEVFDVHFSDPEVKYLTIHLLGKQILKNTDVISFETFDYVKGILEEIYIRKGIDLRSDTELKTLLVFHIQPLLLRMKYGLKQKNPLLMSVKREMNEGFECALIASEYLEKITGIRMDEDEASYLAMHFMVAIERMGFEHHERKVLVVCGSGRGTAKLLQHRLLTRTEFHNEELELVSALTLDDRDFKDVSCILTTVPLRKQYPVPTLLIDLTISTESQEMISSFFKQYDKENISFEFDERLIFPDMSFTSKEECLKYISEKISEYEGIDLYDSLIKREELSSTEVGNSLAVPHPYSYDKDKMIVSITTLNKAIRWKYSSVKCVIMTAYPLETDNRQKVFSDALALVASDSEAIRLICNECTKENITKVFFGGNS